MEEYNFENIHLDREECDQLYIKAKDEINFKQKITIDKFQVTLKLLETLDKIILDNEVLNNIHQGFLIHVKELLIRHCGLYNFSAHHFATEDGKSSFNYQPPEVIKITANNLLFAMYFINHILNLLNKEKINFDD